MNNGFGPDWPRETRLYFRLERSKLSGYKEIEAWLAMLGQSGPA